MKNILHILFFLAASQIAISQTQDGFSYQAIARDNQGQLLTDHTIGMRISILMHEVDGEQVYVEEHLKASNSYGLINLVIGQGQVVTGSLDNIDWASGPFFLQIQIDPDGGTDYALSHTTQLLSVPYALFSKRAATADDAFSGHYDDLIETPDLSIYATRNMQNENITNLADPMHAQDAANKSYVDILINQLMERIQVLEDSLDIGPPPVEDIDGNVYQTVRIGNQLWMKENLRVTHFRNGEPIPNLSGREEWTKSETPGFAWYNNDYDAWGEAYGALYNWYAVIHESGLCPQGWTPAKETDWVILASYLDPDANPTNWPESAIAGGLLKSTRMEPDHEHPRWDSPNQGATNDTGFSALPGGWRGSNGLFHAIGKTGFWWVATQGGANAWYRSMTHDNPALWRSAGPLTAGMSIRCIKH